jgi:HEAT repeat protein
MAALRDSDASVRAAAAAALGRIGGDQTVEALLSVARNDSFDPARAAAHAAAGIDPARVREAAATSDAGPFLREAADLAAL